MTTIVDFYDDHQGAVLRDVLREARDIPEFVRKSAAVPSEGMRPQGAMCAWEDRGRYHLDTPFDAWMSAEYFKKQAHEIPFNRRDAIWGDIKVACEVHGFDPGDMAVKEAAAPGEFLLTKQASEDPVGLYPVGNREEVQSSIAWFPRNLVGDLAPQRRKIAADLLAKAREYGLDRTELLEEELAPTKRSHLLTHIQQRIDRMEHANLEAARWETTRKVASAQGGELRDFKTYDERLVAAFGELRKLAYAEPDDRFWALFEKLDKAAGFYADDLLTPPSSMNREIEDDTPIPLCKLAGQFVDTHQLATKIAASVWQDVAPAALKMLGDMPGLASVVEGLPERSQEILLGQLRGY